MQIRLSLCWLHVTSTHEEVHKATYCFIIFVVIVEHFRVIRAQCGTRLVYTGLSMELADRATGITSRGVA